MAAAAAKAALVAMQRKQQAKENMAKDLKAKNNLNEHKHNVLVEAFRDNDSTEFLAHIAKGESPAQTARKSFHLSHHLHREEHLSSSRQPHYLSTRHYKYLKKRAKHDHNASTIWLKAYLKTSKKVHVADEDGHDHVHNTSSMSHIKYNEFVLINQVTY
jgi:hypothetical protein